MKLKRSRFPKAKTIALMSALLAKILPADYPPTAAWHESQAGHAALRLRSATGGVEWTVDIYSEKYMCIQIGGHFSEVCNSVPSLVGYFCRMLDIRISHD
jgi:hypothetical protein